MTLKQERQQKPLPSSLYVIVRYSPRYASRVYRYAGVEAIEDDGDELRLIRKLDQLIRFPRRQVDKIEVFPLWEEENEI